MDILLKIIKYIPLMVAAAAVCAMLAYIVCVNFLPLKYSAEASFFAALPGKSTSSAAAMLETEDFATAASAAYNTENGEGMTPADAADSIKAEPAGGALIRLYVYHSDPETAYKLKNAAMSVLSEWYSSKTGAEINVETVSTGGIPTRLSTGHFGRYVLFAALAGFAVVFALAVIKGATRDVIASERELARNYEVNIIGTVPYSEEPLSKHKPTA